jgi:hypothetical protein
MKFFLKNKQLFCLSREKAVRKHVDERDARGHNSTFNLRMEELYRMVKIFILHFIEYSAHFFTLKMMLNYSFHGR